MTVFLIKTKLNKTDLQAFLKIIANKKSVEKSLFHVWEYYINLKNLSYKLTCKFKSIAD